MPIAHGVRHETYHESHFYAASWHALTPGQKDIALVHATRLLDEQVSWYGSKTYRSQSLRWPRTGVEERDGSGEYYDAYYGYTLDSTTIPLWLKHATAEMARKLTEEDRTADPAQLEFTRDECGIALPVLCHSATERSAAGECPGDGGSLWECHHQYRHRHRQTGEGVMQQTRSSLFLVVVLALTFCVCISGMGRCGGCGRRRDRMGHRMSPLPWLGCEWDRRRYGRGSGCGCMRMRRVPVCFIYADRGANCATALTNPDNAAYCASAEGGYVFLVHDEHFRGQVCAILRAAGSSGIGYNAW